MVGIGTRWQWGRDDSLLESKWTWQAKSAQIKLSWIIGERGSQLSRGLWGRSKGDCGHKNGGRCGEVTDTDFG